MNKKVILLILTVLFVTFISMYALMVQGNFSLFSRAGFQKEDNPNAETINQESLLMIPLKQEELDTCVSSLTYLQDKFGNDASCYVTFKCTERIGSAFSAQPVQCKDSVCQSLPNVIQSCRPLFEWKRIARTVCGC